jgi:hypothetical protein
VIRCSGSPRYSERVTAGRDDDALTWGGDDDPTLDFGVSPPADSPALPAGWSAVGRGSEAVQPAPEKTETPDAGGDGPAADSVERRPMGNALLITIGVVGGIFLLYTIGWIIGGLRLEGTAQFLVSPVAYRFGFWLAVAAPAVWFATVFLLTRGSRAWVRIVWLLAGIALLVPWPFIMTGAVGQ